MSHVFLSNLKLWGHSHVNQAWIYCLSISLDFFWILYVYHHKTLMSNTLWILFTAPRDYAISYQILFPAAANPANLTLLESCFLLANKTTQTNTFLNFFVDSRGTIKYHFYVLLRTANCSGDLKTWNTFLFNFNCLHPFKPFCFSKQIPHLFQTAVFSYWSFF